MTPLTKYTTLLQATGWSLREWSRRSGLSLNTLRKLSAGPTTVRAQKRTVAALQAALRTSAKDFATLADQLERHPPT